MVYTYKAKCLFIYMNKGFSCIGKVIWTHDLKLKQWASSAIPCLAIWTWILFISNFNSVTMNGCSSISLFLNPLSFLFENWEIALWLGISFSWPFFSACASSSLSYVCRVHVGEPLGCLFTGKKNTISSYFNGDWICTC